MHNIEDRIAFRVRILTIIEVITLFLVLVIGILAFPEIFLIIITFCTIGIVVAGITYWLRSSPIIELLIYGNIVVMLALLAVIDPISGSLSGSTWTLYQIWPVVTSLVLRRMRATLIALGFAALTMIIGASLQISGLIEVVLRVPPEVLWFNLSLQLVVMVMIAAIIVEINRQEQASFQQVLDLSQQREQQLAENQHLLEQQEVLNRELRKSLEQVRQREQELRTEQAHNQDLMRTVDELVAPIIPITDEIVVAPLVGTFNQARLTVLADDLLNHVGRQHIRVIILDVTGLLTFDTATAQALLMVMESCRLMGTETILVGVQPEIAQTIIGLGIDLRHITTRATLQEAINAATAQIRG
ncbi:STAS domain-containing protein [Candidatus Oscillochloris fontis]|uniref:STAS domain-containing protein n=1 Tax=Candidatus Oscillochloris fontis TaxID=2496868 RepID=UPI00101D41A5|nr:STAS domain-containing protein [Candidatus Oscillochloris fontis]